MDTVISPFAKGEPFVKYSMGIASAIDYIGSVKGKGTERQILLELYKYRVLTKMNLQKAVALSNRHAKKNISNTLKNMCQDGAVIRYERGSASAITVIYSLPDTMFNAIEQEYPYLLRRPIPASEDDMLMLASLNQWHIGMLLAFQSLITGEKYYSKEKWPFENGCFKSFLKTGHGKNSTALIALPYIKDESRFYETAADLFKISSYVEGSVSLKRTAIILIVESFAAMDRAYQSIRHIKEFALVEPFFTLDINTKSSESIQWLYVCHMEDGKTSYDTYNINDIL